MECFDKGSLRRVLRFVTIAGDQASHPEGNVLVAPNELLEGVLVSRFGSCDQIGVVDQCLAFLRTALLQLLYTGNGELVP